MTPLLPHSFVARRGEFGGDAQVAPALGVVQDDAAPMFVDNRPFFDLFQRAKATKADKVIA
jgi:hypothetical protein